MRTLKDRKGNGLIFKNIDYKICFYNKKNKFYNKVMIWEPGNELPDHWFKIVVEKDNFNIIELKDEYAVEDASQLVEEPVEEILDWWVFEGEEEIETDAEPVVVSKKVIKYKTYDYKYVIGVDIETGKEVKGWVKTDKVIIEESEFSCPVKYKFSKVKEYFNSQFETIEIASWEYRKKHIPTGLIVTASSFDAAEPIVYTTFIYDRNKKSIILAGEKDAVLEYDKFIDSSKWMNAVKFAPEFIQKEFEENKDGLYEKAGAHLKYNGPKQGRSWYFTSFISESEDGYRSSRTLDKPATTDMVFSRLWPEEYVKAKEAMKNYIASKEAEFKSQLQEIVILDLKGAEIENDNY